MSGAHNEMALTPKAERLLEMLYADHTNSEERDRVVGDAKIDRERLSRFDLTEKRIPVGAEHGIPLWNALATAIASGHGGALSCAFTIAVRPTHDANVMRDQLSLYAWALNEPKSGHENL